MKTIFLILFAICLCLSTRAQHPPVPSQQTVYGLMEFNKQPYEFEDKHVCFPKDNKTGKFYFGFVYLDDHAGYTLHLEGRFQIDGQGKIFRDSTDYLKSYQIQLIRIGPNSLPVYPLPENMVADLKVKLIPDWLSSYPFPDKNTVVGKVLMGKHLNSAGGIQQALEYLESAYKTEPHANGLEFELTYAYNELKQYDKAIKVLNGAITNDPANALLYRELGFAYSHVNKDDEAIKAFTQGLAAIKPGQQDTKAEIAWDMAIIYRDKTHDAANYKLWGQNAKNWAPANSEIAGLLKNVTF